MLKTQEKHRQVVKVNALRLQNGQFINHPVLLITNKPTLIYGIPSPYAAGPMYTTQHAAAHTRSALMPVYAKNAGSGQPCDISFVVSQNLKP